MDFSKITRQLKEDRFQRADRGGWGTMAEERGVELLNRLKAKSNFEQLGSNTVKTDVLETKEDGDEVGYSVKATRHPTEPTSVNKSNSQLGSRGSFRKLMIPGNDRQDFFRRSGMQALSGNEARNFVEHIGNDKVAQAYMMMFGPHLNNPDGSPAKLSHLKRFFARNGNERNLPDHQRHFLDMVSAREENPFVGPEEMRLKFEDHFNEFMDHLDDNKPEIFNQLVRQHDAMYPSSGYEYGDDKPIDRLMHIRSDDHTGRGAPFGRVFTDENDSRRDPTQIDIRDMSDDAVNEAMNNVNWFHDDGGIYLAPDQTDDINERLLHIDPMTAENDSHDTRRGLPRRNLRYEPAQARPGRLRAYMGIDENMLTDVFGKPLFSANVFSTKEDESDLDEDEIITKIQQLRRGGQDVSEEYINTEREYLSDWRKEIYDQFQ